VSRVAVVGAGVSGLTAAWRLQRLGHQVVVLEGAARAGGELACAPVAGVDVDTGAEAFLVTRPEAAELCAELGLVLQHPTGAKPAVVQRGGLVPLPAGTLLGVPTELRATRELLGLLGTARAALDLLLPAGAAEADPALGRLLRRRLGDRVADRLVEPLLGGVYAGRADELSAAATLPLLATARGSVIRAARAARQPRRAGSPVFGAPHGGVGALARALAERVTVRLGEPVRDLAALRGAHDAVVLAVPAPAARRLLTPVVSAAADLAAQVPYASVAVVSLALDRAAAGRLADPGLSGWLVPPSEGLLHKGLTVSSSKWAEMRDAAPDTVLVRASVGRDGEEATLARSDRELVGVVAAEATALARAHGGLLDARVTRWGGALPQYRPGHLDRVQELRQLLPPGVVLCGAAWDGVGVPACVASATRAARDVDAWLRDDGARDRHT